MKAIALFLLGMILNDFVSFAQQVVADPAEIVPVVLPPSYSSSKYEYSGLAKWRDYILLIPQKPNRHGNRLMAINKDKIAEKIQAGPLGNTLADSDMVIVELDKDLARLIDVRRVPGTYDGVEGAVVIENNIYFSVESHTDSCYLLKGSLSNFNNKIKIHMDSVSLAIAKPIFNIKNKNAGFESIGYSERQQRLLLIFERNNDVNVASTVLIRPDFTGAPQFLNFTARMPFRLTDITADPTDNNSFLGINHHFNGNKNERDFYIGTDSFQLAEASKIMKGRHPESSSFTRIVLIKLSTQVGGSLEFSEKKFISFTKDNWEGIIPFENGVLMIVDGIPGDENESKFYYVRF